jgi:hypothetical protein
MVIASSRFSIASLSFLLLANTPVLADAPQTAAAECLAGAALVTFTACMLLRRNDPHNRLQCLALAGALGAGGAAVCYSYSNNLKKRQEALAGHERDLNSQIQYVRGLNEDTTKFNADLKTKVLDVTASTDQTVAQIKQGTADQAKIAATRKELDNEVKQAQAQVDKGVSALAEAKKFREQQTTPSPELDTAIAQQEKLLADAKQQVDMLASQRARV